MNSGDGRDELGKALMRLGTLDQLQKRVPHEKLIIGVKFSKEGDYIPLTTLLIRKTRDHQSIYVKLSDGSEAWVKVGTSVDVGDSEFKDYSVYFVVESGPIDANRQDLKPGDIREIYDQESSSHKYYLYVIPPPED